MATTAASAAFAAASGSTVVNATVFTRIALPEMVRFGYHAGFGAGAIAAAGTIAGLIPPSLIIVVYGLLTGVSIGALLMAGIVPGLLTALVYILGIRLAVALRPSLVPTESPRVALRDKVASLKGIWPLIPLLTIVLGGIYTGFVSPSSAGTIGAAGALLIALARRRMDGTGFRDSIVQTAMLTAVVFMIIIGGLAYSRFLLITGFMPTLTRMIIEFGVTPFLFIAMVVTLYLVLGMFMETLSMMVITVPFLYPVVETLGIDPIWFGIIVVKLAEIAVITPPVGINLYAVMGASDGLVGTRDVFVGVLPFVFLDLIVLGILLAVPELSVWLPETMRR
jgi:tripartite ATP-independent transporter DctM subunit